MDWSMFLFMVIIALIIMVASSSRFTMRKGKFLVASNTAEYLSFKSDLGSFHFKFKEKTISLNTTSGSKTISSENALGISYGIDNQLAITTERLSMKSQPDFNDVIHWYVIKLVLKDRSIIPLFIAGEFERVNWFWFSKWQSGLETSLYEKLGLVTDVDAHCRKVLDMLLASFKNADHELPLI